MANSNFKIFAESVPAANVLSDNEYNVNTQRINGVAPGLASARLHNKFYKQVSMMATAIAQVLVEQGQDALDTDYAALVASLRKSFVLSLNGEKPDANGNIQKNFVYSVEGKKPDSNGNVSLNIDYLNAFSFVGSVVITRDNINPGTRLGGTWQLLQSGRYIRSAGAGYPGGTMGGSDGFTLGVNNLPAHSHEATIYGAGNHKHDIYVSNWQTHGGSGGAGYQAHERRWGETEEAGNHTHQITIKSTGNGEKVIFEPSYLLLYFWVRTA